MKIPDRETLLPLEITDPDRLALYQQDEYKYIVHVLRAFPDDRYRILQYLALKFYPLIVKTCKAVHPIFYEKSWSDLISTARLSFIVLVYAYPLKTTLYFRTYIRIALHRALIDVFVRQRRKKELVKASSLDELDEFKRHAAIADAQDLSNASDLDLENAALTECVEDVKRFLKETRALTARERQALTLFLLEGKRRSELGPLLGVTPVIAKHALDGGLEVLKNFVKTTYFSK